MTITIETQPLTFHTYLAYGIKEKIDPIALKQTKAEANAIETDAEYVVVTSWYLNENAVVFYTGSVEYETLEKEALKWFENKQAEVYGYETVDSTIQKFHTYLIENYEPKDPSTIESSSSDMDAMDVVRIFRYLKEEDLFPKDIEVHITVDSHDDSFENMDSRIVVFHRNDVVKVMPFAKLINETPYQYKGIRESGLRELLEAVLTYAKDKGLN